LPGSDRASRISCGKVIPAIGGIHLHQFYWGLGHFNLTSFSCFRAGRMPTSNE